jgi:hypothetical protein
VDGDWVVVLEADSKGTGIVDFNRVQQLVDGFGGRAAALYSPDRYAIQVSVQAATAADAIAAAVASWRTSALVYGLPEWPLVRAEVMRPEELDAAVPDVPGDVAPAPRDPDVASAVLEATRALLRAGSATQVVHVLIRLVHRLGGEVAPARSAPIDMALPVDLGVGYREPLVPLAAKDSDTWDTLLAVLPAVAEDARVAIERIERDRVLLLR